MFDTFIALFGGIFLAGRKVSRKLNQINFNARMQEYQRVASTVVDFHMQYETLMPEFTKEPWLHLENIATELEEVFGKDWRLLFQARRFKDPHRLGSSAETYCFRDIWGAAYQIYLSHHGQVCSFLYSVYMVMLGVEADGSVNIPKSKECNIKTCRVIERNMQKIYGQDMRLWIMNDNPDKLVWEHYVKAFRNADYKRPW